MPTPTLSTPARLLEAPESLADHIEQVPLQERLDFVNISLRNIDLASERLEEGYRSLLKVEESSDDSL